MKHCYKSESCQFLGIGILDQPMVELDSLHKVLNRNSLVEPMEPLCIILRDKGWSEPGDCQCNRRNNRRNKCSCCVACRSCPQDVDSASYPCWL